jgi:outer membrane protein OmpA-like peptidoglycan-associated protein
MRIAIFAAVASVCLAGSGVAFAADPAPQQTAGEIAAALAEKAPAEPGATPVSDHVCPPGRVWADDGDGGGCDPVKEGTAGFNLGVVHHAAAPTAATNVAAKAPARTPARHEARVASLGRALPLSPTAGAHKNLLIEFISGSAILTPQARSNAQQFAVALSDPRLKGRRFEIAGYTDASGSASVNLALSQHRAEAVKAFLVSAGADPAMLDAKGYGSQDLAIPSDPKAAGNRRVEARLLN